MPPSVCESTIYLVDQADEWLFGNFELCAWCKRGRTTVLVTSIENDLWIERQRHGMTQRLVPILQPDQIMDLIIIPRTRRAQDGRMQVPAVACISCIRSYERTRLYVGCCSDMPLPYCDQRQRARSGDIMDQIDQARCTETHNSSDGTFTSI
ncbi:hypothetical protein PAXRUDRAFT_604731 [Paxillus rubicundulus Ve08.2h10]|uniref:Uncharacterized protein n=1 Tax=Paxillus rubicundulus Ve08.2h10 TaxID=930991 RepID=A0A0D0BP24_9AGAM|nr:hypothetical protein PAXRUDRAFT_604731 [Paxillus rubicundulus Ve08.2h10]